MPLANWAAAYDGLKAKRQAAIAIDAALGDGAVWIVEVDGFFEDVGIAVLVGQGGIGAGEISLPAGDEFCGERLRLVRAGHWGSMMAWMGVGSGCTAGSCGCVDAMRNAASLRCAANDETVRRFGRDDDFFSIQLNVRLLPSSAVMKSR